MFENLIESTRASKRNRTPIFFFATAIIYSSVVCAAVAISIVSYRPTLASGDLLTAIRLELPPPPKGVQPASANQQAGRVSNQKIISTLTPQQPTRIVGPEEAPIIPEPQAPGSGQTGTGAGPFGLPDGVPGAPPAGVLSSILGRKPKDDPPPPPPQAPETKAEPESPRRVISGGVLRGIAIHTVEPVYPMLAKVVKAQGPVQVEITISTDGRVISARVISGHPLLHKASLDAAKQWIFRPTLLSGKPVQVTGILTFNYRLN